jgi:hypothetical protein
MQASAKPDQLQTERSLPARFDEDDFQRILPECRSEPLFIDFEGHRLVSPPFALTPADERRPLSPANLAFPYELRVWIHQFGADMAIQADGHAITLAGLEAEDGEPVPGLDDWTNLKPVHAITRIDRLHPDRARRRESNVWPRFVRAVDLDRGALILPFLTREGSIGVLELTGDRTSPKRPDAIRLTYRIGRGLVPEDGARGKRPRRTILDDLLNPGPLTIEARDEKVAVWRPGSPDWIELDHGKVLVRANRTPRPEAGPADGVETRLAAARIMGEGFDLDGPNARLTLSEPRLESVYSLAHNHRSILWTFNDPTGERGFSDIFAFDRCTVDLPDLQKVSKDPGVSDAPRRR